VVLEYVHMMLFYLLNLFVLKYFSICLSTVFKPNSFEAFIIDSYIFLIMLPLVRFFFVGMCYFLTNLYLQPDILSQICF